ncbi:MAG: hypothetical protein IAE93_02915, partial [Ignavibacteria bacterium]|nr:hypothetical protein [Ignavibacteria bacterium]
MKRILVAASMLVVMFLFAETSANSQALYFFVTNNTGFTLNNIYVT